MSKHYPYGGSTANRTMNCPAWRKTSTNMPAGPTSQAAAEGTVMHSMFEVGMKNVDYEPTDLVSTSITIDGTDITITDKHAEKVYIAYDVIERIIEEDGYETLDYEVMMEYDENIGGTADIIAMNPTSNLFAVGDLKTGDGHMVYAENNHQLLFYAWLAVLKYKAVFNFNEDTSIALFIIQPSDRRDDPYDEWVVNLKDVLNFGEAFKLAVRKAKSGASDPVAGEWCAYCPAQATCPAKTGLIAASKRIPANSVELKSLIEAMHMVGDVESWCRAVRKTAHEQAEAGVKLEGLKLVAKRATRQWNDPLNVSVTFKRARSLKLEDYMDLKLKSPTQMEKVCKAKKIDFKKYQEYISLLSSGTTLVKDSDKRTEVLPLQALTAMAASIKK